MGRPEAPRGTEGNKAETPPGSSFEIPPACPSVLPSEEASLDTGTSAPATADAGAEVLRDPHGHLSWLSQLQLMSVLVC